MRYCIFLMLLLSLLDAFNCLRTYSFRKTVLGKRKSQVMKAIDVDKDTYTELPQHIQQFNKAVVSSVKDFIIFFYGDRYYARFHALETIARVPYFSYVSVLHLYETFGSRRCEVIKLHFAESWNEMHHLLIMEELGGDKIFIDRVVARHIAFFYYWLVVAMYMTAPAVAYDLNKNVEEHAFNTYSEYLITHEQELKALPPPQAAIDYYEKGDLYLFDAFQNYNSTLVPPDTAEVRLRRPVIATLYDVFDNIRLDEAEHVHSMKVLQLESVILANKDKNL